MRGEGQGWGGEALAPNGAYCEQQNNRMGGMGNQDGGDEDFSLKDEEIVKKRRGKKQKGRRGSWVPVGGWRSLCVGRRAVGTKDA
ncbi:hypothetical protein V499_02601 [Pseudogymnoascus sp. VKM F-103]|nr:hypothetical protein V499_02601 [Pseudogymnoascus sp. VKM F-103]